MSAPKRAKTLDSPEEPTVSVPAVPAVPATAPARPLKITPRVKTAIKDSLVKMVQNHVKAIKPNAITGLTCESVMFMVYSIIGHDLATALGGTKEFKIMAESLFPTTERQYRARQESYDHIMVNMMMAILWSDTRTQVYLGPFMEACPYVSNKILRTVRENATKKGRLDIVAKIKYIMRGD